MRFLVREADSGKTAWELIEKEPPDIILLDVVMPGQDGFEICRKIKADEKFKMIPVLYITVMEREQDKVEGFKAGGNDYITKPFRSLEVLARVKAHLEIRRMERELLKKERQLAISALIVTLNHKINNALGCLPLWEEYVEEQKTQGVLSEEDVETLDGMIKQINYVITLLCKITQLSQEENLDQIKYTEYIGNDAMLDIEGL